MERQKILWFWFSGVISGAIGLTFSEIFSKWPRLLESLLLRTLTFQGLLAMGFILCSICLWKNRGKNILKKWERLFCSFVAVISIIIIVAEWVKAIIFKKLIFGL